ncbi:MAG: helix-turn-helix transcriptional regulator, partial [Chloroflexi bacterium]|nr:helix-turn-helix transcriptional regulator [Chloroflexota bacterium]
MVRGTGIKAKNEANQDSVSRRLQIIRAAAALFIRKGLLKTTVREI